MGIGKQIKRLRAINNMSQKELAIKLNKSPAAISKYENEQREPDFAFLKAVEDLFQAKLSFSDDEKTDYRDMIRNQYNDSADLISMGYDPEDARRVERENFERYGDMIMRLDYEDRNKVEEFINELEKGDE